MPSLPRATPTETPPDQTIDAMSRVDGCPECVVNSEPPYRVELEPAGYTAFYHCRDCGHTWQTGWTL